ncbi:hypothetical protein MIR68_006379 [Amoeboaphelidium protococcarum]|nr:hypothetical protein MIR68_006379 [Amoeboaphelidium protococcarum]
MYELAFCIAGIYGCFLSWGLLQERVSTTPYYAHDDHLKQHQPAYFKHFVFLNCVQAFIASIVSIVYMYLRQRRTPTGKVAQQSESLLLKPSAQLLLDFVKVAVLSTIASPFGYESLKHVDYPTMILAKSCKLLPVIIMSYVLYRKVHEWYKYASVLLITAGVCIFTFMHPTKPGTVDARQSSVYGLVLLAINLLLDGVTNSTQDNIFSRYKEVNGAHMMFYMNLISSLLMSLYLGAVTPIMNADGSNALLEALKFLSTYPDSVVDVVIFGFFGSVGQLFIFYTLERFGSLVLVTVNVTRKMLSMILSVFWFNHELNLSQWIAVGVVFTGIGLEAFMTRRSKIVQSLNTSKASSKDANGNNGGIRQTKAKSKVN